ncbi:MAG: DHH family phosphoesterase [Desulfosarcina sp.]
MQAPFGKSVSAHEKVQRLKSVVDSGDSLAILINADPDALASALALKRLLWRRARPVRIFRINRIDRADNLAFIKLLDIPQKHIRDLKRTEFSKWALVDSQPSHSKRFAALEFDLIIDHHAQTDALQAPFIDIREDYGANATLMTEYLRAARIKPSERLATALFHGIKTDTNNFVRATVDRDIIAFRYLYDYVNLNIIKKIESSEMTRRMLPHFQKAMQTLTFIDQTALVHMGRVGKPDILVQMADFFLKMAEATWSIASGIYEHRLIVILRSADFKRSAGTVARALFGKVGSAGGHQGSARAEIPLENIDCQTDSDACRLYVIRQIKKIPMSDD